MFRWHAAHAPLGHVMSAPALILICDICIAPATLLEQLPFQLSLGGTCPRVLTSKGWLCVSTETGDTTAVALLAKLRSVHRNENVGEKAATCVHTENWRQNSTCALGLDPVIKAFCWTTGQHLYSTIQADSG